MGIRSSSTACLACLVRLSQGAKGQELLVTYRLYCLLLALPVSLIVLLFIA